MHITGAADGPPQKVGVAITDVMTGVLSAGAVCVTSAHLPSALPSAPRRRCAALQFRSSCGGDGRGQHIQSSLLETQVFALANVASNWLTAGQEAQRLGNAHASIVPYQTFQACDCELVVGAGNNKQVVMQRACFLLTHSKSLQFVSLCGALGLPDLPNDSRFISNAQRVANRVELQQVLQAVFLQQHAQHWVQLLNDAGVPAQPINNMSARPPSCPVLAHSNFRERVFAHEQVRARDMVQQYTHPHLGVVSCVGHPVKFRFFPSPGSLANFHSFEFWNSPICG